MTIPNVTRAEKRRLHDLRTNFGAEFIVPVREHFNAAGKIEAFANAATAEDKAEQNALFRDAFTTASEFAIDYTILKHTDIFLRAALRVLPEGDLSGYVAHAHEITADDVALLEKCDLPSLAALARNRLGL